MQQKTHSRIKTSFDFEHIFQELLTKVDKKKIQTLTVQILIKKSKGPNLKKQIKIQNKHKTSESHYF